MGGEAAREKPAETKMQPFLCPRVGGEEYRARTFTVAFPFVLFAGVVVMAASSRA